MQSYELLIEGYKVVVSRDEHGGYFSMSIPDLPGCTGIAAEEGEIAPEMRVLIKEHLKILKERERKISRDDKTAQVKQVIVIRKDLQMRRGKEIAQGAHASMKFLIDKIKDHRENGLPIAFSQQELDWMNGIFMKICVKVDSERELLEIHAKAVKAGLTSRLIKDWGFTELKGLPANTAVAIGPDEAGKIDAITGKLELY